jgi:hypothetical protein
MLDRLTLAIGAGALILGAWAGYRWSEGQHARALLAAQEAAQARERALVGEVDRIATQTEEERAATDRRLAAANDALGRLQQAIAIADHSNSASTCQSDAATARALLAECAAEYRSMAREADRLRETVLGLQEYARTVTK